MSDIFETDIDNENENLSSLEDTDIDESTSENLVFDYPLYHLKLDYSSETIYAKAPDKIQLKSGDFVIVPTRYGKDMARVLGIAKKPIGIKQADIVTIDRKASEADLKRREELIQKEKDAFPIFKEKVAYHKLDMKLVETHFLFEEQKALFFFWEHQMEIDHHPVQEDIHVGATGKPFFLI